VQLLPPLIVILEMRRLRELRKRHEAKNSFSGGEKE